MAITVTSVTEDMDARKGGRDDSGNRTYTRSWTVQLDVSQATAAELDAIEWEVETALPVVLYQRHPAWPGAIARTLEVIRLGEHGLWRATVGYNSAPFPARGDGGASDPAGPMENSSETPSTNNDNSQKATLRPPEISFTRKEYTKVLSSEVGTGTFILNTAGDPYDPPLEVERSRMVVNLKFWREPSWFSLSYFGFWDTINSANYVLFGQTFPAKTLRVTNIDIKTIWDQGEVNIATPPAPPNNVQTLKLIYEVNVQLEWNPDSWVKKVLNAGKRQKKTINGVVKAVAIADDHGQPISDPVPLDANGVPVAPGGTLIYQTWEAYQQMSFATLLS